MFLIYINRAKKIDVSQQALQHFKEDLVLKIDAALYSFVQQIISICVPESKFRSNYNLKSSLFREKKIVKSVKKKRKIYRKLYFSKVKGDCLQNIIPNVKMF